MRISIQTKGIDRAIRKVSRFERAKIREIKRIIAKYAQLIQSQAQALAPVDSGNLRESIHLEFYRRGLTAVIQVSADYAVFVEYGTSPHTIKVKNKKVLSDGKTVYGKVVQHPGTTAQPFFWPAIEQYQDDFIREMNNIA